MMIEQKNTGFNPVRVLEIVGPLINTSHAGQSLLQSDK